MVSGNVMTAARHFLSPLQQLRMEYQPPLPPVLRHLASLETTPADAAAPQAEIASLFPLTSVNQAIKFTQGTPKPCPPIKVGVVLSGGQAPGGHNVIAGLFDALKSLNPENELYGFLNGPQGIINNHAVALTEELIAPYRNQGGFDMIGSGRGKIETPEQFQAAEKTVRERALDGLVIVGGDDSNTNAAVLAEHFALSKCPTAVVGVPKTIDGDLKNSCIETSFGFDTACKTYSEVIGNILRDALSAGKYYFFIKMMGRSASHVTLECALQTHPNMALIGEEVAAKNMTLKQITDDICDMICERAKQGKDYGVILIPEGIIEFIPEVKTLISELNGGSTPDTLTPAAAACFNSLPEEIKRQLLLDRDPHGNVQVSKIETERLFVDTVQTELERRKRGGEYQGKFSPQPHFCGYEGRSCLPSNFDCNYCYALGFVAALLVRNRASGYMSCIGGLTKPVEAWIPSGIPLTSMMTLEHRHGKAKPVIKKALVDLEGRLFARFKGECSAWRLEDHYSYPGPIQFFGPTAITESVVHI